MIETMKLFFGGVGGGIKSLFSLFMGGWQTLLAYVAGVAIIFAVGGVMGVNYQKGKEFEAQLQRVKNSIELKETNLIAAGAATAKVSAKTKINVATATKVAKEVSKYQTVPEAHDAIDDLFICLHNLAANPPAPEALDKIICVVEDKPTKEDPNP